MSVTLPEWDYSPIAKAKSAYDNHKDGSLVLMRTTIDVPDSKYRLLKSMAATQSTTVKELVLRGVDVVLAIEDPPRPRRLKLPLIDSDNPGSVHLDNEKIYDLTGFP